MTLLEGLLALDPKWKLAGAAVGFLFLATRCGGATAESTIPAALEEGAVLIGFQLPGEEAIYDEAGFEVLEVRGDWVQVRIGQDKASDRWFNFAHMTAFMLAPH